MIVVNLYGCPGSGKSTAAAYIFYRLKDAGINCEMVTEKAKDLVWDNNDIALKNQLYVAGNQSYRLSRLEGKVDVVITDAPLMLQTVYYRRNNCPEPDMFELIINQVARNFDNLNYLLPIPDRIDPHGRIHGLSESAEIQDSIVELFKAYEMRYSEIKRNSESYDRVADQIIRIFKGSQSIIESDTGIKEENY